MCIGMCCDFGWELISTAKIHSVANDYIPGMVVWSLVGLKNSFLCPTGCLRQSGVPQFIGEGPDSSGAERCGDRSGGSREGCWDPGNVHYSLKSRDSGRVGA